MHLDSKKENVVSHKRNGNGDESNQHEKKNNIYNKRMFRKREFESKTVWLDLNNHVVMMKAHGTDLIPDMRAYFKKKYIIYTDDSVTGLFVVISLSLHSFFSLS